MVQFVITWMNRETLQAIRIQKHKKLDFESLFYVMCSNQNLNIHQNTNQNLLTEVIFKCERWQAKNTELIVD